MIVVRFKCVAVAIQPACSNFQGHMIAWNSAPLGDVPDMFTRMPEDFLGHEIDEEGQGPEAFMGAPDLQGVSIWEGVMEVVVDDGCDYSLKFMGDWRDLNDSDWFLLRRRALEELVSLMRFTVV